MFLGIEERFGQELRAALARSYGRVPSAQYVANQFNQRISASNGVSGESVRRWIRGVSLPRYDHLAVVTDWLGLDFQDVLDKESRSKAERKAPSFATRFSALGPELQERLLALAEASVGLCYLDRPTRDHRSFCRRVESSWVCPAV